MSFSVLCYIVLLEDSFKKNAILVLNFNAVVYMGGQSRFIVVRVENNKVKNNIRINCLMYSQL